MSTWAHKPLFRDRYSLNHALQISSYERYQRCARDVGFEFGSPLESSESTPLWAAIPNQTASPSTTETFSTTILPAVASLCRTLLPSGSTNLPEVLKFSPSWVQTISASIDSDGHFENASVLYFSSAPSDDLGPFLLVVQRGGQMMTVL